MTNVRAHTHFLLYGDMFIFNDNLPTCLMKKSFLHFNWLALAWKLNFID